MKQKYEISIYWSDEDDAYLASVRDLPGCSGDGATYHEALTYMERTASSLYRQRLTSRSVPRYRQEYRQRGGMTLLFKDASCAEPRKVRIRWFAEGDGFPS